MSFFDVLNKLLEEKQISANKMAKDLGLGSSAYTHWKNRGNLPSGDVIQKLADYFDISTDYLLGRTNDPSSIQNIVVNASLPHDNLSEAGNDRPAFAPNFDIEEKEILDKYRALDNRGKETVRSILDIEYGRVSKKSDEIVSIGKAAAYGGKSIKKGLTKEQKKKSEEIWRKAHKPKSD